MKLLSLLFSVILLASIVFGVLAPVEAMPSNPQDETKVPHYFGPYPNWANSPLTQPNVAVTITGDGTGAAAKALVGANGALLGINILNPGTGYSYADVAIGGAGTGATAHALVAPSGSVAAITVNASGAGYTAPTVTLTGGGGAGTLVQVGNPILDRGFATDNDSLVFGVLPTPLPGGMLESFVTQNQALAGGSGFPSAGLSFNAYVLRATGNPNEYSVIFDSGLLTVPPLAAPDTSEIAIFPVGPVAVQAGDVLGFYGQGIPFDDATGADLVSWPALSAPISPGLVTLGSLDFPLLGVPRTYSLAANVVDTSGVTPLVDATASVYGSVDNVILVTAGISYTLPTVDFDFPDDPNGVQAAAHATFDPLSGAITGIVIDNAGSGYLTAPNVVIRDGTIFEPIRNAGHDATATATLKITSALVETGGSGYVSAPLVTINDPTGSGASATALVNAGGISAVVLDTPGSGYVDVGIRKFLDELPGLCVPPACGGAKFIPLGVPEVKLYNNVEADEYEIGLVQYRTSFSSDLPPTLVRGYVQLETPANAAISQHVPLQNELLDGTFQDTGYFGVTSPQWLGPTIAATKNRPVRIVFRNLLPTGSNGDLFLPVDSSFMGSGMGPMDMTPPMDEGSVMDMVRNPMCNEYPKSDMCFKDNRATLHLHGGITPWISDGTPHQWITPAGEMTMWPQGVSVENVPDMDVCTATDDGCQTFYYTNQQSARLMFYHDHAWGITRLNVYAGEAAGYLITDDTEQALIAGGKIPGAADTIPLVVQDRTFVPDPAQLALQDPTWDAARWGTKGSFWYHHVYMPAQNPGDPGGMSAFGRWMYGPWFWPPAADTVYGPIANPYYDPTCNLDDPETWQYQSDPFCEPQMIPGTPLISAGMEQFNDTPVVNGVAYPTLNLEPKTYRFRMLNAANDRFFNFQWYIADPTTASTGLNAQGQVIGGTEVALNAAELAMAQIDPVVFPTPDTTISPPGPDWIHIGSEGGFLPAPAVVNGHQVTTWITDPTRFDVGNVDLHSLVLAPAERADVIVDFSKFAGKTLILYNDAPAAYPARIPSYDYYTGAPDLWPVGVPPILPGYGPNTRTIMQVKIAANPPAPAFNLTALRNAFKHNASGTGVFESGQHPIIVGQAAYNSAYGTTFAASSDCNVPGSTLQRCDGLVRVDDTIEFGFNTLLTPGVKMTMHLEPKAIHDETNATTFDEFGRMQANLGVEAQPPTPGLQNVTLYPYVNPSTELIDGSKLPSADMAITPIATADDGTQIWRVTHNGVDTHPLHFHLFDVQVINRVTWDNIIIPTEPGELGWKDTVRMSPLEDTIVALRPIIPAVPFEVPNSIRELSPMMPAGSTAMFNNIDPQGNPTANIVNQLVNFGWEYVYHCHILSHEEMDMMRPVTLALPPIVPDGITWTLVPNGNTIDVNLTWNDNSITETSFGVERFDGINWVQIGEVPRLLSDANTHGTASFTDNPTVEGIYQYRIVAKNTVGYGLEFPSLTAQSVSQPVSIQVGFPPLAPTNLTLSLVGGNTQIRLQWRDNATNEQGFYVERSVDGGAFAPLTTVPARNQTGGVSYVDTTVVPGSSYSYRVAAYNAIAATAWITAGPISVPVPPTPPAAPSNVSVTAVRLFSGNYRVTVTWTDNANNEQGFRVQRATNSNFTGQTSATVLANVTTFTVTVAPNANGWYFRVQSYNGALGSAWVNATPFPIKTKSPPRGVEILILWRARPYVVATLVAIHAAPLRSSDFSRHPCARRVLTTNQARREGDSLGVPGVPGVLGVEGFSRLLHPATFHNRASASLRINPQAVDSKPAQAGCSWRGRRHFKSAKKKGQGIADLSRGIDVLVPHHQAIIQRQLGEG